MTNMMATRSHSPNAPLFTPAEVMDAIVTLPQTSPFLAKKIKKKRPLRKHELRQLIVLIERAIFSLPTANCYIINEYITLSKGTLHISARVSDLPWAPAEKKTKQYLCMWVDRSSPGLRCKFAVVDLTVSGDRRTVLVTDHVCEQLHMRAGIRGSHVAYIAKSVDRARFRTRIQRDMREPVLEVVDFDGVLLGFCPISSVRCCLQGAKYTFASHIQELIPINDRWRLKTFLPSDYFIEDRNGVLVRRRSKLGRQLIRRGMFHEVRKTGRSRP
jgi:hypothetical protein